MASSTDITRILGSLMGDASGAAAQADLAQAATLARQRLVFRQRVGAAAARVRRAKSEGADAGEIAELEAQFQRRSARLEAAETQARAADVKRPAPEKEQAQVFGRTSGKGDNPPLTAAALAQSGEVLTQAVVEENGAFHLTHTGDLDKVTLQMSDAKGNVLYRASDPETIPAGAVAYVDIALESPKPKPGPVPSQAKMPDLEGQSEAVACAILARIGVADVKIVDKTETGQPDVVIAQSPAPGTVLAKDTVVKLTVRRAEAGGEQPRFIPGLIGQTVDEARERLKALDIDPEVSERDSDISDGIVLDQSPEEGVALKRDTKVTLVVARKRATPPETAIVPRLIGHPADIARELLAAAGLKATISETEIAGAGAGVTMQDPEPDKVVTRNSTVQITVNTPPEIAAPVSAPRLTGRTLLEARRILDAIGLKASAKTAPNPAPKGQVFAQDPAQNTRVDSGSSVSLGVSSGPADMPDDDITRLSREMARDPRAEEIGFDGPRIDKLLRTGGVADTDAATALAELDFAPLRDRLKLANVTAARQFRAVLRKALKALGD